MKVTPRDNGKAFLDLVCPKAQKDYPGATCRFVLTTGPGQHPMWHWDGNVELPTITPSIQCQSPGCGLHVTIMKGVAT